MYADYCESILKQPELLNHWRSRNYSIGMAETLDPCSFGLFHLLGIPSSHELSALPIVENFKSIFNCASKGVILVSFGSIVDTTHMKPKLLDAFLDAFAQFPDYEFIWKVTDVNGNNLSHLTSTRYSNVHPVNWMNQPVILARSVVFISHLGLNSLNEAARFGVPMISIPFFADQQFNTAAMIKRGLGVHVDRRQITAETLSNAIREVLENPNYRTVAKEVSEKMRNSPFTSQEVFVRNVEFSAGYGPLNEWQLPATKETFIQQHSLDLLALVLITILVAVLTVLMTVKWIIRLLNLFIDEFSGQQKKKV